MRRTRVLADNQEEPVAEFVCKTLRRMDTGQKREERRENWSCDETQEAPCLGTRVTCHLITRLWWRHHACYYPDLAAPAPRVQTVFRQHQVSRVLCVLMTRQNISFIWSFRQKSGAASFEFVWRCVRCVADRVMTGLHSMTGVITS